MTSHQEPPQPGFQPHVSQPAPAYVAPYPKAPVGYTQQQVPIVGYPQQQVPVAGYPQQHVPIVGYPQQQVPVAGYPHQQVPVAGYPQQQVPVAGYPQPPAPPYGTHGYVSPQQMNLLPEDMPKNDDLESGKDITADWSGFSNKAIRALFVRKVYAILMLQLTFSLAVICLFVFEKHVNLFVRQNMFMYIIAYVVFLGVYIALVCCGNLRRQYPTNVIMLSIFTVSMSYMLGVISSFHETKVVLMAVGICAGVCLAVSLFSYHSKFDFTTCGGVLFVLIWVLFLFGIIAIFTRNEILNTVYAGCGAMLFVAFLAYDTQMIVGGKKHEMSPEEHIFAAICLYLDVVYIFMFLLMAFGGKK